MATILWKQTTQNRVNLFVCLFFVFVFFYLFFVFCFFFFEKWFRRHMINLIVDPLIISLYSRVHSIKDRKTSPRSDVLISSPTITFWVIYCNWKEHRKETWNRSNNMLFDVVHYVNTCACARESKTVECLCHTIMHRSIKDHATGQVNLLSATDT